MSFFTPALPNRIGIAKRGRYGMRKNPSHFSVAVSTSDIFDNLENFLPAVDMKSWPSTWNPKKKLPAILSLPFKNGRNSQQFSRPFRFRDPKHKLSFPLPQLGRFGSRSWNYKKFARLGLIPPKQKKMFLWIAGFFFWGGGEIFCGSTFFQILYIPRSQMTLVLIGSLDLVFGESKPQK